MEHPVEMSHVPEKGTAEEREQAIDAGTFYREFIRPGRGIASVVAEVEDPAAEARLIRLLGTIEKSRHSSSRSTPSD